MTSLNRQQRRSLKHTDPSPSPDIMADNGWDDLESLYLDCRALSVAPAKVVPLIKNPDKLQHVTDMKSLLEHAKVLNKDAVAYNERLEAIHRKHAGKTGSSTSSDELMEILVIGEEYQEWLIGFQTVVTPVVDQIMGLFNDPTTVDGDFLPANEQ